MTERARSLIGLFLVAIGAALFAVAFRSSLALVYRVAYGAQDVVGAMTGLPAWLRVIVPVGGGLVAGLIASLRPTQGVSNVMEAVALGKVHLSFRTTLSRVTASWSAIATGLSIGREGPLIEFGGTLGATVGRVMGTSLDRTRVLVAAGTAAGFAAAYNTPFAAVLFVLETIVGIAALEAMLPTMAAAVMATALTRAVVGGGADLRSAIVRAPIPCGACVVCGIGPARRARGFWLQEHARPVRALARAPSDPATSARDIGWPPRWRDCRVGA